ncbi:MAG: Fic family protein [Burkholderiales bacterium]|nr:MAG: Fic family protein [Burkholderiales bacterium]
MWQLDAWPAFTWNPDAVQAALQNAVQAHMQTSTALSAIGMQGHGSINRDLWSQDALATAAIEGQSLDVQAVRSSVGYRLGLAMPRSADRDVEGLVQVMQDATQHYANPVTDQRLCEWQKMLFPANADKPLKLQVQVGAYRSHAEPMQIISGILGKEKVHYTAPPSAAVPHEMAQLLYWLAATSPASQNNLSMARPPWLVRAALAHLWFETIHPFEDGNGRVGRALADYVLAQELGTSQRIFSLSRQILAERKQYYEQLEAAQHASVTGQGGLDVTAWVLWFIGVFTRGCQHSLSVIRLASDKAAFWQRCAAFNLNERQRKVLARLLDAGDGGFLGGLTAEKYIKLTGASKATATRDLTQLHQSGLLAVQGQGKGTRYAVAVADWHSDFSRHASSNDLLDFP